jgi:hypothetical protein
MNLFHTSNTLTVQYNNNLLYVHRKRTHSQIPSILLEIMYVPCMVPR